MRALLTTAAEILGMGLLCSAVSLAFGVAAGLASAGAALLLVGIAEGRK